MEEKEEGGISLKDIFSTIFSQKWLALIITAIITVAGTLGIYFVKNRLGMTYDVAFTLELPQTKEKDDNSTSSSSVVSYPDGTTFYYTDIVSLEKLTEVKESDAAFKNIDIKKMSKSGDISILRNTYETANNSGTYESIYELSVKASYFSNKDVARDFMVALTKKPIDYLRTMNIDYDIYINSAKAAPDYVTEISQLIAQANYIINRYDTFVEIYNDLSIDIDGTSNKTLRSYSQEIKSYLNNSGELEILLAEARKNAYLKSKDLKVKYSTELYKLRRQFEIAEYTLNNLLSVKGDSEFASSAAIIKTQSDLVAELKQEIGEIEGTDGAEGTERLVGYMNSTDYEGGNMTEAHKKFKVELVKEYDKVQKFTEKFKDVVSELYGKVSVVSYSNSNVIETSGVTSLIMALIISFVAGAVIAMIVAYIVGWTKQKKAASAAQQAPEETPVTQTQADNQ